jgi:hypothetical protein
MLGVRRAALTLLLVVAWLLVQAQPASAHTVSGVGATNWRTTLIGVSPAVPGLRVRVVNTGSDLEVSNTGPEVVVLGYEGEPYLRVGPAGVYENTQSPSTYVNCSRQGCPAPPGLRPDGPPDWRHLSSGHVVRYHDHRIHWMGGQPPPDVQRAPGQVHQQPVWTVSMRQGSSDIAVTGHLTWVPGPSPFPWLLVALGLAGVAVAAALSSFWGPALAALVGLLTVNDVWHAAAIAFSPAGTFGQHVGRLFTGSFYSVIGWVLGVVAVWFLAHRRVDGLYAAAFAGVSAALFTGILDVTVLSRSTAPFAGPMWFDRATTAVSLGLGVGIAVGSVLAIRRAPRPQWTDDVDDDVERVDTGAAPA